MCPKTIVRSLEKYRRPMGHFPSKIKSSVPCLWTQKNFFSYLKTEINSKGVRNNMWRITVRLIGERGRYRNNIILIPPKANNNGGKKPKIIVVNNEIVNNNFLMASNNDIHIIFPIHSLLISERSRRRVHMSYKQFNYCKNPQKKTCRYVLAAHATSTKDTP